jgi:Integrase core domain
LLKGGYFHIDIAEVRTEQGKLHMFVTIDRTSKFCLRRTAREGDDGDLGRLPAQPSQGHAYNLTDNGIQFTTPGAGGSSVPLMKEAMAAGETIWAYAFEYACAKADIEHRTTKPKHPWTNGQVERMNRTIKDATVKRFYYDSHDLLRQHIADFLSL